MIITSRSDVEAAGAVERLGSALRYPLVGPDMDGAEGAQVSLPVLAPGSTHTLAADGFEEGAVIVGGEAELPGGRGPSEDAVAAGTAATFDFREVTETPAHNPELASFTCGPGCSSTEQAAAAERSRWAWAHMPRPRGATPCTGTLTPERPSSSGRGTVRT